MKANWFVAIPVAADAWLKPLIAGLPATCRPFDSSDIHLTIAFLGALPAPRLAAVQTQLCNIQAAAIAATFGAFMPLPSAKRLSAISMSLRQGHDEVCAIIRQHRASLAAAAAARPDERPPLPHATIARPIRKFGQKAREDALHWMASTAVPEVSLRLDRIALYTWSDQRPQVQFRKVSEKNLSE